MIGAQDINSIPSLPECFYSANRSLLKRLDVRFRFSQWQRGILFVISSNKTLNHIYSLIQRDPVKAVNGATGRT